MVADQIKSIEERLRSRGHTVTEMLQRAKVDGAQWQRWKAGKQTPLMSTWGRIEAAVAEMLPEAVA